MSVFRNEELICPVCGQTFSAKVIMSYSVNGNFRSLDGDPHVPELFDMVCLCPHCGYAFTDPKEEADAYTRTIVHSENYQKVFQAEDVPETARKLLLAGYLAEQKGDAGKASVQYLHAYWFFRNNGLAGIEEARDKAIEGMEKYLESKADKHAAMVLVDLLRQKGAFEAALDAVNSLGKYLKGDENLLKAGALEWKLIMAGDAKEHMFGEVDG